MFRTFGGGSRSVVGMDAEGGILLIDSEGTAVEIADFNTTSQQRTTGLIFACEQCFGTLLRRDNKLTYLRGILHGKARIPTERQERNIIRTPFK